MSLYSEFTLTSKGQTEGPTLFYYFIHFFQFLCEISNTLGALFFFFTNEETEAQKHKVTGPRSPDMQLWSLDGRLGLSDWKQK